MITIGGITYHTLHHISGTLDGACCETCIQDMYAACREGTASIPEGADFVLSARFQILKYIHMRSLPLSAGSFRKFLLTGDGYSAATTREMVRQADYSSAYGSNADYHIRYAMAYLIEYMRSPGSYASTNFNTHIETLRSLIARESSPFDCECCEETITGSAIRAGRRLNSNGSIIEGIPNICGECLNNTYTYLEHQNIWVNPDSVETVPVRGIAGYVTMDYARANFHWREELDEDGEETGDGYWTIEREEPRDHLMHYMANPFDYFSWDTRNKQNALVFGVELEMEPQSATQRGQQNLIAAMGGNRGKNFILKSDGSLNYGVELVTMPFTLSQHLDNTGVPWKEILAKVDGIARSGTGTTACGIHIHINKKALSALTIGKMLVFLNSPDLASLISIIAQRGNSSFCQRSAKKLTDGTRSSENRYDIMNVSVRHPTCEIRMFRGNVTPERVYKNIEFCHALVQYCRQASMRALADWGNFAQWLIAHRGQYQNLVRFLIDSKAIGFRQLARDTRDGQTTIIDR